MDSNTKRNLQIKQTIYRIALISFVVVVVWIGFEIYYSYKKRSQEKLPQEKIEPITANLYLEVAQSLQDRLSVSSSQLSSVKNIPKPSASPNLFLPSQTATPSSGFLSNTPSSTPSAQPSPVNSFTQ